MKRNLVFAILAGGLVLSMTPQALAARLKQQVVVEGAQVTFGDLFDDAGEARTRVFAAAPPPGERQSFRPSHVQAAAQAAGIAWTADAALRTVTVERAGRAVARTEMQSALARALGLDDPEGLSIQLSGNPQITVALDRKARIAVEELDFDRLSQRFAATLVAPAGDPAAQRLRVSGRIEAVTEIPVLRSSVAVGQVIGRDDLEFITVPVSRLGGQTIAQADDVVGFAARRALAPGRPIRTAEVQRPMMVAKGALISITVTTPVMSLSTVGRAIEGGARGDVIQVMNMQSKKTVSGTVIAPGQVEVGFGRQLSSLN